MAGIERNNFMTVDVFTTVRGVGYPIEVLFEYDQEMNRYAFLMVG